MKGRGNFFEGADAPSVFPSSALQYSGNTTRRGGFASLQLSVDKGTLQFNGVSKRGVSPSLIFLPPPLSREGDKGGGSPNQNRNFTPETI